MTSRRQFVKQGSLGLLPIILPLTVLSKTTTEFEGIVVSENEGDAFRLRDGRAVVKIKISKRQGAASLSLLNSTVAANDAIRVHKHLNEDEFFFIRQGTGLFTLGDREHAVASGSMVFIPKGTWHGLKNTGTEEIANVFGYSPAGFEDFFRELGTAIDKPFVEKTTEERKAIAKKWGMVYKD
ncbi:MAG: cupin domain-containing protein [Flavisolibacter sp.]